MSSSVGRVGDPAFSDRAQFLAKRTTALPVVSDKDAELQDFSAQFVVSNSVVLAVWDEFKRLVAEPVPVTPEAAAEVPLRVQGALSHLTGIKASSKLSLAVIYSGTPRDGFCDLLAREGEDAVAAYKRLTFEESLSGLLMALNFSAGLKRKWSWGHGYYDRDAELLINTERLLSILEREAGQKLLKDEAPLPPTSFRIAHLLPVWSVSCLAARPGRGF